MRDPGGDVYVAEDCVYRAIRQSAIDDHQSVRKTPLIEELIAEGLLLPEQQADVALLPEEYREQAVALTVHPKLNFISYPYEWTFSALQAAAILHLKIHLRALQHDVTLSDASAYNIQFQGCRPIFIDHLSFRPYQSGEFWLAHRQFCQQFLNPLLLQAKKGVAFQHWYRGYGDGLSTVELANLLSWRQKLSWRMLTQVVLQAKLQNTKRKEVVSIAKQHQLPKAAFIQMLQSLLGWIQGLKPARKMKASQWTDYAQSCQYDAQQMQVKKMFVDKHVRQQAARTVWDLGCNEGDFSKVALQAGAKQAIGFESDLACLESAWQRAKQHKENFLPLYMNLINPSSGQGWAQQECDGLMQRGPADCVLSLAIVHHLAIANNIPLKKIVEWIMSLGQSGVIEFVPKSDPMVKSMLSLRKDIFDDYTCDNFLSLLSERADISAQQAVGERLLISYRRKS